MKLTITFEEARQTGKQAFLGYRHALSKATK